jgi:hypothetical protein
MGWSSTISIRRRAEAVVFEVVFGMAKGMLKKKALAF